MKLYDAVWAPSPRRVRIFLSEKGIELDRQMIDLRSGEQLGPDYLAINPAGTLPALQLDDGEIITESAAICRYLEALHPAPALFGATPVMVGRVESWTRRIEADGYAAAVYVFRNSRPALADKGLPGNWPPIPQIPELATRGAIMWNRMVEALDDQLAHHEWIAGDAISFADITALVTVDFAAKPAGLAIPESATHLMRWYKAMAARPSASA